MVTWGSSISRRHPSGGAPRKVALCGDPEGWGPDRVSMDASLRWHDGEEHHTATGAGMCGWGSYSVISKSSYSYWSIASGRRLIVSFGSGRGLRLTCSQIGRASWRERVGQYV